MPYIPMPDSITVPFMAAQDRDPSTWTLQPGSQDRLHTLVIGSAPGVVLPFAEQAAAAQLVDVPMASSGGGTTVKLRDYQLEAVDAVADAWRRGAKAPLVIVGTGGGKTIIAAEIMARMYAGSNGKSLFLAHREELLTQTMGKVRLVSPNTRVGMVQAKNNELGREITVASIQTLGHKSGTRLKALIENGPYALVVLDEGHHATSATWTRVLQALHIANPAMLVMGMTATPARSDGIALDRVFDVVAYEKNLFDLIRDGWLVPPHGFRVDIDIDLDKVETAGGDYVVTQLSKLMNTPHVNRAVVEAWRGYGHDRKCLVFACDIAHAHALAQEFNDAGHPAAALDGTMKKKDRDAVLDQFRQGALKLLVNCEILTEGYDDPSAEGIVFARPTQSQTFFIQCLGRGLRLHPLKTECIAEGQRVLTDRGLVPIERVTTDMLVWDGVEFVSHEGAICRGTKETISYAGLVATPDHQVQTEDGWRSFGECAEQGLEIIRSGNGRYPIRTADRHERSAGDCEWAEASQDPLHDVRRDRLTRSSAPSARESGLSSMWQPTLVAAVASESCDRSQAALHQSPRHRVRPVRREGNPVSIQLAVGNGDLGAGALGPSAVAGVGSNRQQRPLRARQPSLGNRRAEHGERPQAARERGVSRLPHETSGGPLRGRHAAAPVAERDDDRADHRTVAHAIQQAQGRVWDILNCGPRHRFTVEGLLVSNCIVIDCVGNSAKHQPVQLASLAGFDPERKLGGGKGFGEEQDDIDEPEEQREVTGAKVGDATEVVFNARKPKSQYQWRETTLGWILQIPRVAYYLVAWSDQAKHMATIRFFDQRSGRRHEPPREIVRQPVEFDMAYGLVESEMDRLFRARERRRDDAKGVEDNDQPITSFVDLNDGTDEDIVLPEEELMLKTAGWRENKMSPKQRDLLISLGVKEKTLPGTAGEASDLITIMRVERDMKMRVPATLKQIQYLRYFGLPIGENITKGMAAKAIWTHRKATGA